MVQHLITKAIILYNNQKKLTLKSMKRLLIYLLVMLSAFARAANPDTTLMTIGNHQVSLGEFEYLYHKNNQIASSEPSSLDEYFDLFINFKLKVIAAEEAGYDTVPSFIKELAGYRDQLAEPYLKDQDLTDQLLLEAYNRLKEEVEASHILIRINGTSHQDSVAAYNKIMEARKKVLAGEDFASVAKSYSEDPSAANNGGHLGYFSGFQMVLPFEETAFNTAIDEVSMPFTSRFGYHVLKVHNRRPSRGEVSVSHILLLDNEHMTEEEHAQKKEKIYNIYQQLLDGKEFEKLAKEYSEDHGSSTRGGSIGFIKSGQTIPPFENAAFALKENGDISEPVKTRFGWHIIRLDSKRGLASFEDKKADIKRRLARDERGDKPERVFIDKLKKEYHFTTNKEALNELYQLSENVKVDSAFKAQLSTMDKALISYGDASKTQNDFAQYALKKSPKKAEFKKHFSDFVSETLKEYEKSRLEIKYEDFRYLMQEYHDGLLLFEISNKLVWGKASEDTLGLEKFYKKNKKQYRFTDSCYQAEVKLFKDSASHSSYLAMKDEMPIEAIQDSLNTNEKVFDIIEGFYKLGDDRSIDALAFNKDATHLNEKYPFIINDGQWYYKGDIKPLAATRGACISDYQNKLEEQWIKQLRRQHKVRINKDIKALVQ